MLDLLAGFTYIISLFLSFCCGSLADFAKNKKEIGISLTQMDERDR
jgi:hypothetical protein